MIDLVNVLPRSHRFPLSLSLPRAKRQLLNVPIDDGRACAEGRNGTQTRVSGHAADWHRHA
eukprot:8651583-Lingulodinium_polyedra.AAC.1